MVRVSMSDASPPPSARSPRRSALALVALVAFFALRAGGCFGSDIDEDNTRGLAKAIALGQVVTDTIAPPDDAEDWKVIQVPGSGFLTVTVFWDIADVEARVQMVDNFGRTLQDVRRDDRTPRDQMIIKAEGENFYYLRVKGEKGESVYSVQTSFSATAGGDGTKPGDDEPIPEFIRPIDVGAEGDEVN